MSERVREEYGGRNKEMWTVKESEREKKLELIVLLHR